MNLLSMLSLATIKSPQGLDRAALSNTNTPDGTGASTFAGLLTKVRGEPVSSLPPTRLDVAGPGLIASPVATDEISVPAPIVDSADAGDSPLPLQDAEGGDALPLDEPVDARLDEPLQDLDADLLQQPAVAQLPLDAVDGTRVAVLPSEAPKVPNPETSKELHVVDVAKDKMAPLPITTAPQEKSSLAEMGENADKGEKGVQRQMSALLDKVAPLQQVAPPQQVNAAGPATPVSAAQTLPDPSALTAHAVDGKNIQTVGADSSAQRPEQSAALPDRPAMRLPDQAQAGIAREQASRADAPASTAPRPDPVVPSIQPTTSPPVGMGIPASAMAAAMPRPMTAVENLRGRMPGVAVDERMMDHAQRADTGLDRQPRLQDLLTPRPEISVQTVQRAITEAGVDVDPQAETSAFKLEGGLPRAPEPQAGAMPRLQAVPFGANNLMRFGSELTDRVISLRAQSLDRASLALEPADLGRIEIRLRMDSDTTHVSFVAHNSSVREALEAQLPRLRTMLEAAGLLLGDVDIDQSGRQGGREQADQPRDMRRASNRSTPHVHATDPQVDRRRADGALIDVHA